MVGFFVASPSPYMVRRLRPGMKQEIKDGHPMFIWGVKLAILGITAVIFPYQFNPRPGEPVLVDIISGRRTGNIKRSPGFCQQIDYTLLLGRLGLILACVDECSYD